MAEHGQRLPVVLGHSEAPEHHRPNVELCVRAAAASRGCKCKRNRSEEKASVYKCAKLKNHIHEHVCRVLRERGEQRADRPAELNGTVKAILGALHVLLHADA